MFNYLASCAIKEQAISREATLPIRNRKGVAQNFGFIHNFSKSCLLFFHGFTAGCYQSLEPLREAYINFGYNVLVPLVPGHGISKRWNSDNPPPYQKM
jgi:pimeloyl-ACP methyl ester carboxylesterase